MDLEARARKIVNYLWPELKAEDSYLLKYFAAELRAVREETEAEFSTVLEFCEGAIADAIKLDDGLDGATGQKVIEMIKDAQKGKFQGCQHCDLQYKRGLLRAAEMAKDAWNDSATQCNMKTHAFAIADAIRKEAGEL